MMEEAKTEKAVIGFPSEDVLNSNSESLTSKVDAVETEDKVTCVENFAQDPSLPLEQPGSSSEKRNEVEPKINCTQVTSVDSLSTSPLEKTSILSNKVSEIGTGISGNEEKSVDGSMSLPPEQFVTTSLEKTDKVGERLDGIEITLTEGPTISPPEQFVNLPGKTSEVGPVIDGTDLSVHEPISLPQQPGDSSPGKAIEAGARTDVTSMTSVEVSGTGTSSCDGVENGKGASSELESENSVISSLDKSNVHVDGFVISAIKAGAANSTNLDESTNVWNKLETSENTASIDGNKQSDRLETNAPLNTVPVRTSDDVVSIKHEAYEEKLEHIVPPQHTTGKQLSEFYVSAAATLNSATEVKQEYGSLVDTAAPFESVKEAVSKFGGIIDWKTHKAHAMKRREFVQLELEKAGEEIPVYKKQAKEAEEAKTKIIKELQDTKRLIEDLKLNLEKVQTEEAQAKQDSELSQLRVEELEQGIAGEASVAVKTQVDVAKKRHATAVAELENVRVELRKLQEEQASLIVERDDAIKRAEDAVSASSNSEKIVEDLTLELITAREALEVAHAAHLEAEEHRIGASLARDQDSLTWNKELKQAEDELAQLNEKLLSMKDLQSKLDTASALLLNLKAELGAYMEAKLNEESEGLVEEKVTSEPENGVKTHADAQETVASVKKEIEEVKADIEKGKKKVEILKDAAASLKSQLETEKVALASMQQREGMASVAVSSLEAEVKRTRTEIEGIQTKEKEAREQMLDLPKALQKAAHEAEEAKSAAQSAREELKNVKEEEEQVKASVSTLDSRLNAALKEIEAAKVSEGLALAAVKALQESEHAEELVLEGANNWVTLPLDDYYALSKKAHDAEEEANEKVASALSQIQLAKESESKSLHRLEEVQQELSDKKVALGLAKEKHGTAKEGKLAIEQELRKWRADRKKAIDASQPPVHPPKSPQRTFEQTSSVVGHETPDASQSEPSSGLYSPEDNPNAKAKKKKASLLPKIVMLLARKKHPRSK